MPVTDRGSDKVVGGPGRSFPPVGRRPRGQAEELLASCARVERGLADALIVTGPATGAAPEPADLARVRERVPAAPLLVGSGLTVENAAGSGMPGKALQWGGRGPGLQGVTPR
jgi:hypothetical protein